LGGAQVSARVSELSIDLGIVFVAVADGWEIVASTVSAIAAQTG